MRDFIADIRKPIEEDMKHFDALFDDTLSYTEGTLAQALNHIRSRVGKRMRPMLAILIAKAYGEANEKTYRAGVGLELLHTASLVHDDVVDRADKRRGQRSMNNIYDNRVAVLVGDYILSTALLNVSLTGNVRIMESMSRLGQTLSNGEILQLTSNGSETISEETYYEVIEQKTAALFEEACVMGALSVEATQDEIEAARMFGRKVGIIFQIRDDIFDYFDSEKVGKPTGNDMAEGKLTLPAIHTILTAGDDEIMAIAQRVKSLSSTPEERAQLVEFVKQKGGIDYAKKVMHRLHDDALLFVNERVGDEAIKNSLTAYLDYCIERGL
ncbi:MAG: polyprenyl synthetase family protein [Prevotella sp.]|nr:polyprenyl synthetase family protein [Prevotella sp.]